jgi:hypothetical protein
MRAIKKGAGGPVRPAAKRSSKVTPLQVASSFDQAVTLLFFGSQH